MRNWIVWHYTFGVNCTRKFNRSHAHIFYYVADPKRFTFNADAVRVPSARQTTYADRRANPVGKLPDDTWVLRPQEDDRFFDPAADTWYVPRVCGTFKERGDHPCQMPLALLERIVRVASHPGDLVLDAEQIQQRERAVLIDQIISEFRATVTSAIRTVTTNVSTMEETARNLSTIAHEADQQAHAVSASSEETSINMRTVAGASDQLDASNLVQWFSLQGQQSKRNDRFRLITCSQ